MAQYTVDWGDGELPLSLPDHWTVSAVAEPKVPAAAADWADRLAALLTRPEGTAPLPAMLREIGPHGRIVLVVEDATRHSPLADILAVVVRELDHAQITDDQVEILFATGMHPAMNLGQVREKVGPFADRFAWRCNNASDLTTYMLAGEVLLPRGGGVLPLLIDRRCLLADLRIVITAVTPHLQAGFGGGAKMLVPGCAALETISRLHLAGLPWPAGSPMVGVEGHVNPMRRMIDAAGEVIEGRHGRTFAVQYVLDAADRPSTIAAGNLRLGQQMLAKQCAAASGIVIDTPADILITNAWPRDYDMWQAFKCIANTREAVRPNGVICVLARCPAGLNMGSVRWPLSPTWTRRLVRWVGVKGIVSMARRLTPGVNPEAHFFIQLAAETLYRNPILMYAPEVVRRGQRFPGLPLYGDLDAKFADADRMLGEGSRRVILFPAGGASYPVL